MPTPKEMYYEKRGQMLVRNLKSRHFDAYYCANKQNALAKALELIPVKDIQRVTGYVRGGCSPIGMKKLYRTVFHESASECEVISVSAGKIGYQVRMNPSVLATLAAATIADVCKQ